MFKTLKRYLADKPITLTVCKSLISCPEINERKNIIYENHATKIGGHKGINKTYNRIRQNFHWPTIKRDIQEYIKDCRDCQIKKLTRVKTKQPMIITDTPKVAFEKISIDVCSRASYDNQPTSYIHTNEIRLTNEIFYCCANADSGLPLYCRSFSETLYLHLRRT